MQAYADIAFFESRAPITLAPAPWIVCDPRIIDLDRSEWSEISPIAAIETGAFAPKGGR